MLAELVPLIVTGGACLVGLGMVDRDTGYHDPFRWPTIALLFVASAAHVPVIPSHLQEAPYMGVLFTLFTVSAFALAALLAARPGALLYSCAALLSAAAVVAYVSTRLVPFPLLAGDVGNWAEPLGIVSVAAEVAVVVVSVRARRLAARRGPSPSVDAQIVGR
jgi:hypothetical protein